MTSGADTIIGAVVAAAASIVSALIAKYDLGPLFQRTKFDLTGQWRGVSILLPIDIPEESYTDGGEAIYRFTADLKQSGGRLRFSETVDEFFDINLKRIDKHAARSIQGTGRVQGDKDVIIQFREKGSLTCGTMYLTLDTWGKELRGIISVRNPYFGTPVAVKIVFRRSGEKPVAIEDLRDRSLKIMADAFLKAPDRSAAVV